MKHLRRSLSLALATFLVTLAARPCGPDFPDAVFVLQNGPSGDYASYAAGRLGIPRNEYRTRHLVIAYDYLNGHPLPAAVQKEAIAVNSFLLHPSAADDAKATGKGFAAWIATRANLGPVDGYTPSASLETEHPVPGQDYQFFNNCLDDSFATAASTLTHRVAAHGASDPAVMDWVRAQDAVFTNCGDGKVRDYFGPPDNAPAPPPAPRMPAVAPASSPAWLQQDRAYQLAAASFYRLDFDDALRRFREIAAQPGSPWSIDARYLIARTYLRKATLNGEAKSLELAQHELLAMRLEPRMAPLRGSIDGLTDYVDLRLQPKIQAAVLATRLESPAVSTYRQAVLDLTWLHTVHDGSDAKVPKLGSPEHTSDLLAWLDAFQGADEASSLQHWHSSHSAAWLVLALTNALPGEPAVPELLQAAHSTLPGDPGYLSITYNRLRLSPQKSETYPQLLALLPQIEASGDRSAINLFLALSTAAAPTLDTWVRALPRVPAGDTSWSTGEESLPYQDPTPSSTATESTEPAYVEDVCGKQYPANTLLPLFDADGANALNRDMPLRLLAQIAETSPLPEGLRNQIAQATWARAVLLERPDIARRMTPILVTCRAAWKPVLAAYDSASTTDTRQAAGLLALMRFASTVPSVWDGEDRRMGFATYDDFRQNWWCSTVPKYGETVDLDPERQAASFDGSVRGTTPPPRFLSEADLAEAHSEVSALARVPRASTYFAQRALAWQADHPADPLTPEILGEADRVLRNSCRKDPPFDHGAVKPDPTDMTLTPNLARALIETLHRNYPNSSWAKRYKTWE